MATLATISNRFIDTFDTTDSVAIRGGEYQLRPLANEDVYLFVKTIDNAKVVRQADPQAAGVCWRFITGACVTVVMLTAMLLPSAYSLLAGYQVQKLKAEQQRQLEEQAVLDQQVAALLSPARLAQLAEEQQFSESTPDKVIFLNPHADGKVAMSYAPASPVASHQ